MSGNAPLLIEIGCEEIPARMIGAAAAEFERRVVGILDDAGLTHGGSQCWSGPRRLAVRVDDVLDRQPDRDDRVLGPPAKIAFDAEGNPTPAALGFAKKQGIDASLLAPVETERGPYAAYQRHLPGKHVGELLAERLQERVASMTFPKTMRWADGTHRWVRPVHWLVALHGAAVLDVGLFGVQAGRLSRGHRFRSSAEIEIGSPQSYAADMKAAFVLVDPAERRQRVVALLTAAAKEAGGQLVEDARLLEEVADLVEWPGVVVGRFEEDYLELPAELLSTTLRHHQKCFSLTDGEGNPIPAFLALANTDQDPEGHVQRGNEWVVSGRLDDARFFWRDDRRSPLDSRSPDLAGVVFHAKVGSFAEKAKRMSELAGRLAERVGLDATVAAEAVTAAAICKNDLVTGTVGEFPELQGQVGGLMLRAEERSLGVAQAVYEHYLPAGAADALPQSDGGAVVSLADKLDSIASLIGAGETPTGSRDPLGLRRAGNGVFRVLEDRGWDLSITALGDLAGQGPTVADFLAERLVHYYWGSGATANEVRAVLRDAVDPMEWRGWRLADIRTRLGSIATVRDRADFEQLADLTKRVDNVLTKGREVFEEAAKQADASAFDEDRATAVELAGMLARDRGALDDLAAAGKYDDVVDLLATYVAPVERFFEEVLVVDKDHAAATLARRDLMLGLHGLLTSCFDLRELAGQADGRNA